MYKSLLMIMLIMISGCKDKYERILDEVSETSMSVRKCELKKLASEKPTFPCKKSTHKIAIEKARALGIKENRINAAINVGILQTDQDSFNLIKKGNLLKVAIRYKTEAEDNLEYAANTRINIEHYISGGNEISIPGFSTPTQCNRTVKVYLPNWRYETISNKYFNVNECIKKLSESQILFEDAARIWAEKAIGWENAAKKIKSEY